jgi:hypothetical protein
MNSATAFATTATTLRPLVRYGEQQDKEANMMKCGNCHGADSNGAWLLAAHAAADFAKLPQIIPDSNENKFCTNSCAKGTAAFSIKMQTGVVI